MTLTRQQFKIMWNRHVPHDPVDRPDHPLWIPETDITPGAPSKLFVRTSIRKTSADGFWAWCNANIAGPVRCYMHDDDKDEEWWGLTTEQDAIIFTLKWA